MAAALLSTAGLYIALVPPPKHAWLPTHCMAPLRRVTGLAKLCSRPRLPWARWLCAVQSVTIDGCGSGDAGAVPLMQAGGQAGRQTRPPAVAPLAACAPATIP